MKNRSEIFCAPPARKKRGSQIFRLRRAFFVVEALKTARKPLKTAKNCYIFQKTSISPAASFFSTHWSDNFTNLVGQNRGRGNILYPPLDNVCLDCSAQVCIKGKCNKNILLLSYHTFLLCSYVYFGPCTNRVIFHFN